MITKFVNELGDKVFAETGPWLVGEDFKVGAHIMINGFFYIVQGHHIEFSDTVLGVARIVIVKEA